MEEERVAGIAGLLGIVIMVVLMFSCSRIVDKDIKRAKEHRAIIDKCIIENKTLPDYYLDYQYFSFISQLTIGYGDITTINPFGKILTIMQGL